MRFDVDTSLVQRFEEVALLRSLARKLAKELKERLTRVRAAVTVTRGLAVDVNGNTVSGDMGTDIDLSGSGDSRDDEELIYIKISTVSGDIRIEKAS